MTPRANRVIILVFPTIPLPTTITFNDTADDEQYQAQTQAEQRQPRDNMQTWATAMRRWERTIHIELLHGDGGTRRGGGGKNEEEKEEAPKVDCVQS
jgi:hypothetical protein